VTRRPTVSIALLAVTMTACAAPSAPGTASPSSSAYATGPEDLVLRWGYEGGFTPPEFQLTSLPTFSLYGDGTVVRPGPQIEIYPGPALPALESFVVEPVGVEAIVQAAFDAGLDTVGDLTDLGSVGIADAADTVFTLRAGGVDRTVRVYALSELGGQPPGMNDDEYRAREALIALVEQLSSLEDWLPEGSVGPGTVFEARGSRVYISEYRSEPDLSQRPVSWPLSAPLAEAGDDAGTGFRCLAVTGDDWSQLEPLARRANQLTPWIDEGERYSLAFRPLLPDETGC
jgi:hypothetical protein